MFAQSPEIPKASSISPQPLVLPVRGAPLVVDTLEEQNRKLPDGGSRSEIIDKATIYRDGEGRMRTERHLLDPAGRHFPVVVMDLNEGFMAILDAASKVAYRVPWQKAGPGQLSFGFLGGALSAVAGEKKLTTESLGRQIIQGLEFEGTRITTTVEGQPSLKGIDERWMSTQLGLIGLSESFSSITGQNTAKIQRVERREPDSALFIIPGDYVIREVESPGPPR